MNNKNVILVIVLILGFTVSLGCSESGDDTKTAVESENMQTGEVQAAQEEEPEPASTEETVMETPDNKGTLDVLTSPTGASVTVDRVSQGSSPVKGLSVDEGKHTVDLYLSGYNPKTLTVYVTSSDTKTIDWNFTPYVEPNPTTTESTQSTNYDSSLVRNYDVIQEDDISMKALTKSLSAYTTEEINSLPLNVRKEYRVVISSDISEEELKSTLIQVVMDKTSENNEIDEVVVFAYDREEDVNDIFTLGKVEWCPNGDWGSMAPEIASSNDRSSYQYVFDIKDKVGNIDASEIPTEREYEIYDYYEKCYDAAWGNIDLSDPTATVDEDLIIEEVAKKYEITKEEASRICDKVVLYKMS